MAKAKVTFQRLIQDSQDYGSNDAHMISRAFFSINIEGNVDHDSCADIKQPVGADFESTPLKVSKPIGYRGPFNYEAFRNAAENYYRSLVGSRSFGIHISDGRNIRMKNNIFIQEVETEFEVSKESFAW